jgi:hypothetical protein
MPSITQPVRSEDSKLQNERDACPMALHAYVTSVHTHVYTQIGDGYFFFFYLYLLSDALVNSSFSQIILHFIILSVKTS